MDRNAAQRLLDAAIEQAEKSWDEGGIPIGAALGRHDGTVVAVGHNMRVQSGDPTAHAEIVCIRNAGRRRDWGELVLASTLSPCSMCTGAACLFGIKTIIVGENKTFQGAEHWLEEHGVDTHILDHEECINLMLRLQDEKPDLWAEDIGK